MAKIVSKCSCYLGENRSQLWACRGGKGWFSFARHPPAGGGQKREEFFWGLPGVALTLCEQPPANICSAFSASDSVGADTSKRHRLDGIGIQRMVRHGHRSTLQA